jgi:ADP-ribose pyrophosphatase
MHATTHEHDDPPPADRHEVFRSPIFSVERRVFEVASGKRVERDVVVHPGAVVVLPLLDEARLVMIRNFRYTVQEELWELPAGTREAGEEPIKTAARELEEETGYRAGSLEPLTEFYTSPGICTERMYAFVAAELTWVGQRLEPSERIDVEEVTLEDARRQLLAGEFRDGKTIATLGIYFARHA